VLAPRGTGWRSIVTEGAALRTALGGHPYLARARRLRRHEHHHGEPPRAKVLDRVVDAGRDQRRILLLQLFDLRAALQSRPALDDDVERV
jgi:hypothetical protein